MISKLKRAARMAGMRPMPQWRDRPTVDLRGKRILLTGASSGIGAVAAEKLAAEGATVIAVARREHLLEEVVERIVGIRRNRGRVFDRPFRSRSGGRSGENRWSGGHLDKQRRTIHPQAADRLAGTLARHRTRHAAQLLRATSTHSRCGTRHDRTRGRSHHQRRHVARIAGILTAFRRIQRVQSGIERGQPRHRHGVG